MDPIPDLILPEKFLGYSRESNLEPFGWQSDVLTTLPNRWSIFDYRRVYLAAFHVNSYSSYKDRSKISDELWLRNEGLAVGEALLQLYIWFCNEKGYGKNKVMEDLKMLGRGIGRERNEVFKKECMWRDAVNNSKK